MTKADQPTKCRRCHRDLEKLAESRGITLQEIIQGHEVEHLRADNQIMLDTLLEIGDSSHEHNPTAAALAAKARAAMIKVTTWNEKS